ncbi:MAG: TIR domain-containing protein [Anaerolineaceae bacterium]|nr:TIR domain-containing protein [Anaerolineaceae bacterium]
MKNDVFISYSSKDRPFAQKLAKALEQQGISVWIDRDDIRAGIKWSSAIQEGLDLSSVIIVIISHDSMSSKNVEDEWQYFLDKRKPIVPILHSRADNIHFQLMRIQYIDFVNNPFEDAVQLLVYELRQYNVGNASANYPVKSIPLTTSTEAPTASRSLLIPLGGIGLLIAIILGVVLVNQPPSSNITPTSPVVTQEATIDSTATEVAVVAATETAMPPTEVTAEPTKEAVILTATLTPTIGVTLDIPYVSQFGAGASFPNDDGPAALLMVLRWYAKIMPDSETARRVIGVTVEDVGREAGMTSTSNSVSFGGLMVAANFYKLPYEPCKGINRTRIFTELDNGNPVLILVDAKRFRPDINYDGGHTVVIVGYDADHVIIDDPHNLHIIPQPKVVSLTYDEFDNVTVNIYNLSVKVSQALIFGENNHC